MDIALYLKFLLALVFVLALIGLLAWAARRFGLGGRLATAVSTRRLAVVEVLPLDARHKLVLLGASHDLLLEGGIAAMPLDTAPQTEPETKA